MTRVARFAAPPDVRTGLGHAVIAVRASRAAWLFAAAWLVSALVLVASGQGFPLFGLLLGAAYLLLSLVTVALTQSRQVAPASSADRPRLWLQTGLILLFVVLTGWNGLVFHDVVSPDAGLPLWSPLVDALHRAGGQWFGNDNYLSTPATYLVIPLVVLVVAGARVRGLGFGPGHRIGRNLLLWAAIPVGSFAVALATGQVTVARLAGRLVSNFMQNGFFEEFLFRGALQTRLRPLWGPGWALVVQALVFGAWHLGLGYANTGNAGFLPALASTIVNQAVIGLAFGVIFERTRNLLVPSVAHVLVNSMG